MGAALHQIVTYLRRIPDDLKGHVPSVASIIRMTAPVSSATKSRLTVMMNMTVQCAASCLTSRIVPMLWDCPTNQSSSLWPSGFRLWLRPQTRFFRSTLADLRHLSDQSPAFYGTTRAQHCGFAVFVNASL